MVLINDEPVELVRFNRQVWHNEEKFWTSDLSGPWWWEHTLSDRETLTDRPVFARRNGPVRFGLDNAEKEAMREAVPEFVV